MRLTDLFEVNIDNDRGWGSVPNNQEVDYLGLRVKMRPSIFLKLAAPLEEKSSLDVKNRIASGGSIASPYLVIAIPKEWMDGDFSKPARVETHEGRNRMKAILEVEGNEPIEVHLFFADGVRNRHLTNKMINAMNNSIIPEESEQTISGPFWSE